MYKYERFFIPLQHKSNVDIIMTGITAKRNSVSRPKTAISCGLTLSAAIRRVKASTGSPSAAIPETVIIGDRGPSLQAISFATPTASPAIKHLFNNTLILRRDEPRNPQLRIPVA